jgi:hypothetical protein
MSSTLPPSASSEMALGETPPVGGSILGGGGGAALGAGAGAGAALGAGAGAALGAGAGAALGAGAGGGGHGAWATTPPAFASLMPPGQSTFAEAPPAVAEGLPSLTSALGPFSIPAICAMAGEAASNATATIAASNIIFLNFFSFLSVFWILNLAPIGPEEPRPVGFSS